MGKEVKEKTIIFFMILFIILAIILIFIGFINLKPHFTGKAISVEKESFVISEPIKGTFNLELKEGELIPSNTEVIVTLKKDNKKIVKELSLKELVEISDLKVAEQQGKFFIENKKIEGEGFGYGWPGHYIVYPNVYFQLKVSKIAEESKSQEIEEPLPELPVEQEVEQESQEIMSEQIEEEQSTEQESQKETSQSEETEQSMEQTEQSAGQNLVSITASAVFKMIKFFGIWNSFAVLEENGKYKIIEASCSNENPFFYDLKENEKVELVSGTVHTEDKKLKDDEVNIEIKNNKVEVSTNYFESFEGFGEAYLNKEKHYFSFNLEKLNLKTDEPGTYDLIITLVYRGQELLRESEEIEILPGAITIKVIDKEGNVEDEIAVNNTKIKLKIGKIKVGREIEHELEIEKENLGITGSAIIEQPLPESEINFISMPEDVVIQIDKVPEYQTEVFAIEPSKDIEIESAIITLEKTTAQPIARILQCDEWDIEEFKCNGEWKDSGLEFLDNGTHVSFTTNHFTAYIGESNMTCPYYVNEDVVLVSNVSCNGTAFIINASDVSIDCQGYTINYNLEEWGVGIDASVGLSNITIKNCIIASGNNPGPAVSICGEGGDNIVIENSTLNSNFDYGIDVENCDGHIYIHNNTFYNNNIGIETRMASGGFFEINNNTFYNNFYGLYAFSAGGCVLDSGFNANLNNFYSNSYGIYLEHNYCPNNVSQNLFQENNYGLRIYSSSFSAVFENNFVNNARGIELIGLVDTSSSYNQFFDNNITNSAIYDLYVRCDPGACDANSFDNFTFNNVKASLVPWNIVLKATTSPAEPPSGYDDINKFLEINNNTENSWLLLNISYLDSEIGSINESTLRLWKYNGSWHQVDSDVDIDNNVVYMNNAEPPSSVYAVMGEGGAIDDEAPRYSQDNDNSTGSVVQGKTVKVYVYWQDNVGLSYAIFRTNESGTWQNVSICSFSGANGWCNATIDTTGDAGKTICWNQYANDTSNNWNTTMSETLHCFRVTTSGGGGGGGGGAYCGDGICNNNENCTTCPEDCHSCGDGCCSPEYGESYSNCWQDCCYLEGVNRPVLPLHVCCPGLNTVIPYDMNCVANQFWQCAGCEATGAVTCVKCGNGICGPGENFCNCPQDCPLQYNVTDCSELPELDVNASWLESSQEVQLSWNSIYPILKTRIMEADKVQGQNNLSNFSLKQELESWQISWQSQVPERLKFFQVVAKVKIGNLNSECKPECYSQGLNGNKPGWYDPCTETLLKEDSCIVIEPLCCFKGTRSEGWYNAPCDQAQENNRITYAQCEPGEYAIACNQSSGVFVKFTQPLKYNPPTESNPKTSINWIVMMPISGWTINDTKEILQNGMPIDYIAYWDAERQLQYGSARGDLSRGGFFSYGFLLDLLNSVLPGQYLDSGSGGVAGAGGYGGQGGREIVITGPFNLQQGHPYFISATQDWDRWTYVGKVPEHVTFEFKTGSSLISVNENYVVLPLDTNITKASQLCDIRDKQGQQIIAPEWVIRWWNPLEQKRIGDPNESSCLELLNGIGDFSVEPGKVYQIKVQRNASWQQI
ncbi:MAG: right-handed parallel beta-helix repeat-containing protein [Candidatus Pacearchaeota archaeon]